MIGLLGILGCRDDGGLTTVPPPPPPPSGPQPTASLSFLRQSAAAPALTTYDTSFVATRGQDTDIRIRYLPTGGSSSGEEFLEFDLDDETLLRYPASHPRAGAPFVDGDTVTIRIQIDPTSLIVTMEPSGLEFDPDKPAELEIRYGNADDDWDGDGSSDPPSNESLIELWRQENPGDPWFPVGQLKDAELDRIRAELTSFSRYALAI